MTKESAAEMEDPMEATINEALADKKLAARYRNLISHLVEVKNTLPEAIRLRVLTDIMDGAELESVSADDGSGAPDADTLQDEVIAALVESADLQEFVEAVSLVLSGQQSPQALLLADPDSNEDPLLQLGHAVGLLVFAVMEAQANASGATPEAAAPAAAEALVDCPVCEGSGFVEGRKCAACNGQGKILVG